MNSRFYERGNNKLMNNKKKLAIIGASEESLYAISKAKELGYYVIALDGNPGAAGLKYADDPIVCDISDEQKTISVLSRLNPEFVLTVPIGRYLTTIGAVNDALGLPGLSKTAATYCTDKYAFHNKMQELNLRSGHCILLEAGKTYSKNDLATLTKELSYPAICKPRYGSGSRGIIFANSFDKLLISLSRTENGEMVNSLIAIDEDLVIEEAADGTEYGADVLVFNNKATLLLLRKKILTPLPERQAVGYLSVSKKQEESLISAVEDYLQKTVNLLTLDCCMMHADLIISDNNEIYAIELSGRPSGHNLHNLFTPLATGVDMIESYIMHKAPNGYPDVKPMLIHYFSIENKTVSHVPNEAEISEQFISYENTDYSVKLVRYNCNIKEGDFLSATPTGHSLMGRGYFILQGADENTLLKTAVSILNLFLL